MLNAFTNKAKSAKDATSNLATTIASTTLNTGSTANSTTINQTADCLHMSIATLQQAMIKRKLTGEISAGVMVMSVSLKTKARIIDLNAPGPSYKKPESTIAKSIISGSHELVVRGTAKLITQVILLAMRMKELGYSSSTTVECHLNLSIGPFFGVELGLQSTIEEILRHISEEQGSEIRRQSVADEVKENEERDPTDGDYLAEEK